MDMLFVLCFLQHLFYRNVKKRTYLKVTMRQTQMMSPKRKKPANQRYVMYPINAPFPQLIVVEPPKNSDIGTANIPHNNNIRALRERWMCHAKPGCSSEHCFINPV